MSDLQVYFYMWDNRHLWAIDYPDRPSMIWICLGIYNLVMATCSLQLGERGMLAQAYVCTTIVSGLMALLLGFDSYCKIEPRKLLAFNIDEIGMQINHYFKRKEAIFSPLGLLLVSVAAVRSVIALAIAWTGPITDLEDPLTLVFALDSAALMNLAALWSLFVVLKVITQAGQALCPISLGKFKAYGNAKKRVGPQLFERLKKQQ